MLSSYFLRCLSHFLKFKNYNRWNTKIERFFMACPMCNKIQNKKYRPFCSKRCADLDLGKWLTESYSIPAMETDEEDSISTEFTSNGSNLH